MLSFTVYLPYPIQLVAGQQILVQQDFMIREVRVGIITGTPLSHRIFVPMKASKTDKTNPIKLTGESPAIVQIASDDRGTDRMNNGSSIR